MKRIIIELAFVFVVVSCAEQEEGMSKIAHGNLDCEKDRLEYSGECVRVSQQLCDSTVGVFKTLPPIKPKRKAKSGTLKFDLGPRGEAVYCYQSEEKSQWYWGYQLNENNTREQLLETVEEKKLSCMDVSVSGNGKTAIFSAERFGIVIIENHMGQLKFLEMSPPFEDIEEYLEAGCGMSKLHFDSNDNFSISISAGLLMEDWESYMAVYDEGKMEVIHNSISGTLLEESWHAGGFPQAIKADDGWYVMMQQGHGGVITEGFYDGHELLDQKKIKGKESILKNQNKQIWIGYVTDNNDLILNGRLGVGNENKHVLSVDLIDSAKFGYDFEHLGNNRTSLTYAIEKNSRANLYYLEFDGETVDTVYLQEIEEEMIAKHIDVKLNVDPCDRATIVVAMKDRLSRWVQR